MKNLKYITAISLLTEIDYDAEMADLDNPTGAIIREVWHLQAELPNGARYIGSAFAVGSIGYGVTQAEIDKAVAVAEYAYMKGADVTATWQEHWPAYGSAAYLDEEPEMAFAERQAANDNWFGNARLF